MGKHKWRVVLFDMDGTTLDTLGDLRTAINYAMGQTGHRSDFSLQEASAFVGSGILVALARALLREQGWRTEDLERVGTPGDGAMEQVRTEAERIAAVFRPYYTANSEHLTRPYPGIMELLGALRAQGIRTAIVSNKPDAAVQLLGERFFPSLLDAAMGEREPEIRRKPAPDMVWKALEQLGQGGGRTGADMGQEHAEGMQQRIALEQAVYIGDSEVDLQTARNAGMACISVSWGFRSRTFLEAHGAEAIVDSVQELANLLLTDKK